MAEGFTVAVPCGRAHGLHTVLPEPSFTASEVAVPPVTCQARFADEPGGIVLGVAVRLSVKGTVTVTVAGADVPPGPVAVMVNVVVLGIVVSDDPDVGNGPVSSG